MPSSSVSRKRASEPHEVDVVAYPYVHIGLTSPARWYYARRHWYEPARALRAIFDGNQKWRRKRESVLQLLDELGIGSRRVRFVPVEHHLAHASSAYHLSGFKEKTAIVSIDGKGEYATTFFGYGENGRIHKIKEFYDPDSLGWFYGALTEYLGFEIQDGEYKVMGMAPYGDPQRYDLSRLIRHDGASFRVNTRLINVIGRRRYRANGKEYSVSPEFVRWLGPVRNGDDIDEPYIHYAAAAQRLLEDTALALIDHYVGDIIRETGKLCFAGGVALNVKLNQRLLAWPHLKELFVQPAAGDAGTSVGAASYAATSLGEPVRKMEHVYLGPSFSTDECIAACRQHPQQPTLGTARRRARARGADHRRRAAARVVSGTDGVRTAGARQPQHPGRPEPRRAWPSASMDRSSTASAGGRFARACSIPWRAISSNPIIRRST